MRQAVPYDRRPMNVQIMEYAPRFNPRRLAAARRNKKLRQRDVAAAIGRALRHYQRIESGDVGPTVAQLGQFKHLFDVTIDSLYTMPEEEECTPAQGDSA